MREWEKVCQDFWNFRILYSFPFDKNNFIRIKALILEKRKNKACCRTEHKSKVSRLAILKIIRTKHPNKIWLPLILNCMKTMVAQMVQNSAFFTICVQSYFIHIQSSFLYSVSHLICIQSHLIYIQSTYMYSVSSYLYSVKLYIFSLILFLFSQLICIQSHLISVNLYVFSLVLFIFSQLICIQSHLIYIQATYIYSVPSYMYSVLSYMYSVWSYLYSVNLYVFSHMLCLLSLHLFFVNMFNVLWVTLRNLIKTCSFLKKSECMPYRTIFHKEIKQTIIFSKRKIFILIVLI